MATIINAGQTALTITPDTTGALTLQANGTNALQITANGQITTANAPFILTGGRIQFPSTKIASADANCLDDYEEGTWTPAWLNFGTGTYDVQQGKYTKIGRMVTVECYLAIASIGSATGNAVITGLPFPPLGTVSTSQMWTNNWASSAQNIVGLGGGGSSTQLSLYIVPASSAVSQAAMSNMTNSSNILFSFSYFI